MNETTREWLEVFQKSKDRGEILRSSVFWCLAVELLPRGVDPDHPDVIAALTEIRASIAAG